MVVWTWQASIGLLALFLLGSVNAWGSDPDRVLLKDVEVLTLRAGKMTNGRRSSPVPQLDCVGGSAAKFFKPQVVQCYNRGFDGFDAQWECKTDMESDYRIGHLEVNCEGYDYPEDKYILRGSCGLRYTLDFTKAGMENKNGHYHDYYGDSSSNQWGSQYDYSHNQYRDSKSMSSSSFIANIIVMCAVGLMLFALYKTCVGRSSRQHAYSTTNDDPHPGAGGGGGGYGWFGGQGGTYPSAPPPPTYEGDSCRNRSSGSSGSSGGGGFWTGAATGGLLGYMFGQSGNRTHYNTGYGGYAAPRSSFFGGQSGYSRPSHHHAPPSAPRTASGFGGTSRR